MYGTPNPRQSIRLATYSRPKLTLLHYSIVAIFWVYPLTTKAVVYDFEMAVDAPEQPISQPDSPPLTFQLDPIVVTATRSDRLLSSAPVPVQVLGKETLQQHHAHTLKQALALLPNVTLREIHGKSGYEVLMQGFSGDQVLVLIDGMPVTASTGSTVDLAQYLNVDVEQIEVIQGAASAQYGSSAMGGVINVITKPIQDNSAKISAEVGSNGKQNPSGNALDANRRFVEASIEGTLDKAGHIRARLSGSYLDDAGLSLDTKAWPRLKDASEQSQLTAKVAYDANPEGTLSSSNSQRFNAQLFNDTHLWAEASHYSEDDMRRFNYYVAPKVLPQQKLETITKQRFSVGGRTNIAPSLTSSKFSNSANLNDTALQESPPKLYQLSGSALYERYTSESNTLSKDVVTSNREADISTALAQVQLDLPMWQPSTMLGGIMSNHAHLVQLGAQWQQDELSQTKNSQSELIQDKVSRDVSEVYVQDDWFIGDNWEILSGVRYQEDTDFGGHAAPKASVKYNLTDTNNHDHIFRASVGSGYRVPNLKERYYIFDHSNLGYKVIGNPNLQPETSTSYQIGYAGQMTDNLNLSINGFYNDINDLIQINEDLTTFEGNIAIYHYMNVDSAKTYGADIGVDWRVSPEATLKAAYTYTKTQNNHTGSELTLRPQHQAQLGLDYQLTPKLQLVNQLNYEGRQLVASGDQGSDQNSNQSNGQSASHSPAWWTLDSKVNYQMNDHFDIYAGINNIFDTQRDPRGPNGATDYRPIDNREWLLGASYHW